MNEKFYVSIERHVCVVCGVQYDTGTILFDRRLRQSLEYYTTTGCGLCPEHEKLRQDGYVALVECDLEESGMPAGADRLKPSEAFRTGRVAYLKRDQFAAVFNVSIKPDLPFVYVEPGVIEKLTAAVTRGRHR
jgi:hypothetical protein